MRNANHHSSNKLSLARKKAIRESCEEMYSGETDEYIIRIVKKEEKEALKDADLELLKNQTFKQCFACIYNTIPKGLMFDDVDYDHRKYNSYTDQIIDQTQKSISTMLSIEILENCHQPPNEFRCDIDSDPLEALDRIPVNWHIKRGFAYGIYYETEKLLLTKNVIEEKYQKSKFHSKNSYRKNKKHLDPFKRLTPLNIKEIEWSHNYFYCFLISNDNFLSNPVKEALSDAENHIDENNASKAFKKLRIAHILWLTSLNNLELFSMKYSQALSQFRFRNKNQDKVPLNTYISSESRSQLKKLAIRKKKTQYEVLEELIYHEFHSKKSK